jgi:plastocyanin
MNRTRLALFTTVLSLLLAAAAPASGRRNTVTIRDFAYGPQVLHVHHGTTVLVVNRDSTAHSFTSASGKFDLTRLRASGGSGRVRFTRAGTYHYFCAFHAFMRGTIVVR